MTDFYYKSDYSSSVFSDNYGQRKQRAKNKKVGTVVKKFFIALIFFLLFFIIFEIIYIFIFMPKLIVRKIEINLPGESYISVKDVVELSGISEGDNFFAIDLDAVRKQILESNYIKEVTVRRKFFCIIAISIQERVPIAIIIANNNKFSVPVAVDESGTIFQIGNSVKAYDSPVLSGIKFENIKLFSILPEDVIFLLKDLENIKSKEIDLFNMISELKFNYKGDQLIDILVYPVDYSVPVRFNLKIDSYDLRYSILTLDALKKTGLLKNLKELDFRTDKIIAIKENY